MPKALEIGPYKFHFVMFDCNERMHVHVYMGKKPGKIRAKVWLVPMVEMAWSKGFKERDIARIMAYVSEYQQFFKDFWHEKCSE